MKMNQVITFLLLSATFGLTGCAERDAPTPAASVQTDAVDVQVNTDTSDADDPAERRQERRENVREALEDVDVNVGAGGVDVEIGDGESGVKVDVD